MQGERECRTERVTKYTHSSKIFELFMASDLLDQSVGRLREAEHLLAWLPKVLSTCHHCWLFAPVCTWNFWVSGYTRNTRASQTSQNCSPFSANLWDGWRSASLGQENENSRQIFNVGVNAHSPTLWDLYQGQHSKALCSTLDISLYKYL